MRPVDTFFVMELSKTRAAGSHSQQAAYRGCHRESLPVWPVGGLVVIAAVGGIAVPSVLLAVIFIPAVSVPIVIHESDSFLPARTAVLSFLSLYQ